jgi:hypothetical protein
MLTSAASVAASDRSYGKFGTTLSGIVSTRGMAMGTRGELMRLGYRL